MRAPATEWVRYDTTARRRPRPPPANQVLGVSAGRAGAQPADRDDDAAADDAAAATAADYDDDDDDDDQLPRRPVTDTPTAVCLSPSNDNSGPCTPRIAPV